MSHCSVADAIDLDFVRICEIHIAAILAISVTSYSDEMKKSWAYGLVPSGYEKGRAAGERYRVAKDDGGSILGFSSTLKEEIVALYVDPKFQRQGIGHLLLNDAENQLQSAGAVQGKLKASLNGEVFYKTHGWVTQGYSEWQSRGGLMIANVLMTKRFNLNADQDV